MYLATRGIANFFLKGKAVLRKNRNRPNGFGSALSLLKNTTPSQNDQHRSDISQPSLRRDLDKDSKEESKNDRME